MSLCSTKRKDVFVRKLIRVIRVTVYNRVKTVPGIREGPTKLEGPGSLSSGLAIRNKQHVVQSSNVNPPSLCYKNINNSY